MYKRQIHGEDNYVLNISKDDKSKLINFLNDETITLSFNFNTYNIEEVLVDEERYIRITIPNGSNSMEKGYPDLPSICRNIIIPDDVKMDVKILNSRYKEFDNISIAPSKGSFARNVDPEDISYVFGEVYSKNGWFPRNVAELMEPYILRDFRGETIKVYPFQYNHVEKILRFYNMIKLIVYPIGRDEINVFERREPLTIIDPAFNLLYEHFFINYDNIYAKNQLLLKEGELLVICYDDFYSTMKPFAEWKNTEGIPTVIVNLSNIGNSSRDIARFIEKYYLTHNLTYVVLVGDIQQIPTRYITIPPDPGPYASDPSYSYIEGRDHYPEIFIGRFSAQNISQLQTQVERTISYENHSKRGTWVHRGVGIASNDGPFDEGEYEWQHIRNIRLKLLNYTYTDIYEFYDGSHGGGDNDGDPKSDMIVDAVDDGCSIINYCGHGSCQSWTTSRFNNSNIYSLTNEYMFPFVICVACYNGQFDRYDECFCEAWLRVTTENGKPVGAIVATGSSKYMMFCEPMAAQDAMIDILRDGVYIVGVIHTYGCLEMMSKYQTSWAYYEADCWHIFGDPSVEILVNFPPDIPKQPSGETNGKTGRFYSYTTTSNDTDGDQIYYKFSWGDGSYSNWLGPYNSGDIVSAYHSWNVRGNYEIKVKAKDIYKAESEWSVPLTVEISKIGLKLHSFFIKLKIHADRVILLSNRGFNISEFLF